MSHSEVQNHRKGFEALTCKTAQRAERAQATLKKIKTKRVCLCLSVTSAYHKDNLANRDKLGDISLQPHRPYVLVYKTENCLNIREHKFKTSLTSSLKGWKENSFVTTKQEVNAFMC